MIALYGPSGAGKSLTLQAMAGLLQPARGHVRIGARTLFDHAAGIDMAPPQRRLFLREQDLWLSQQPALAGTLKRMAMKTTARNQFAGTVSHIDAGPVTTAVTLTLRGGNQITATLTTSASKQLGLKKGREAIALVKSSAIVLVTDFAGYALSARNQLAGSISRLEKGAVSSLVGVTLPGGSVVTASVTNDAVDALPGGRARGHRGVQGLFGDARGGERLTASARCAPTRL